MALNKKQVILLVCDILVIQISLFMSFWLRFEGIIPKDFMAIYSALIIPITLFKVASFIFCGLYKKVWRYASITEMISICKGVVFGSILLVGYVFFLRLIFPRSIIIIDFMITLMLIGSSRMALRILKDYKNLLFKSNKPKRVIIVGAGDAGEIVVREFKRHTDSYTHIIGFIDDDPAKINLEVHGVRVLGDRNKIPELVEKHRVDEVVIALPSASGKEIRAIHRICSQTPAKIRTLPSVYEIINGDIRLEQIREVQVEDLLGRESIQIDMNEVASYLTNKRVLITGGGGSIGSELCRQVARFKPEELIIFDIGENNVYDIDLELKNSFKDITIVPVVGSIRDKKRLIEVFQKHRPHVVFHAAAHKHVPLMEYNPAEAVKNNIFGTRNVSQVSHEFGVEKFVMISTDKAVNPTNIMGATKRVAEMIVQDMNKNSNTKFVAVRFGNVLGSRGSVIPLFKQQIAMGGPLTVTHPEITRYFMTIPEASQLVIQAGALGQGGEVFVLDMGEPVKIIDLAKDLIELSGLKVGEDIEIKITGLRPGEKLYEELLTDNEGTLTTRHERIMIAKLDDIESELLNKCLAQLEQMCSSHSASPSIWVSILVQLVATFKPSGLHDIKKQEVM